MNSSSIIYIPKPNPTAKLRIFCFPYGGGSASTYVSWPDLLSPELEVAVVQLPGRGIRLLEPPYQTMAEIVKNLVPAISAMAHTPYIIFGHSLGARIAYEVITELQQYNYPLPLHFIASGAWAPGSIRKNEPIHQLPNTEFIKEIIELNTAQREVLENAEMIALLLPVLRADFKINETHKFETKKIVPIKVSVVSGDEDHDIEPSHLELWFSLFTSNTGIHWISGNHFFVDSNKSSVIDLVRQLTIKSKYTFDKTS